MNAKSSSGGKTALALAAFVGHFEIFESLTNHGADIGNLKSLKSNIGQI